MKNMYWQFLRFFLLAFILVLVPVYATYYGPANFLWLSDIGLFLTCAALWLNSPVLMSVAAVTVFAVEVAWNVDFFVRLIFQSKLLGLSDYMFDGSYPLGLRFLSTFHIILPIIWISYLKHHGYSRQAVYYASGLYWGIVACVYFFTDPSKNIDWVFSSSWVLLLVFPALIFLPTHYIFTTLFPRPAGHHRYLK